MGQVSIREALQRVADHPVMSDDDLLQHPVHELVCRNIFELANHPDANMRGSMVKANRARKLLLERLVGKRRAGSHPATRTKIHIDLIDLTGGELGESTEGVQPTA